MEALIRFLVSPLVEDAEDFEIDVEKGEASIVIELRAEESELERIKGEGGATLDAIRQVMSASGGKRKPVLELIAFTDDDYTDEEDDEDSSDEDSSDEESSDDDSSEDESTDDSTSDSEE